MKYAATLLAVRDMTASKQFYRDVLGLKVISDFGENVTLTGGVALQSAESWRGFIKKAAEEIVFGNHACELYFEEDDMDAFFAKLRELKTVELVHPLIEHAWGQRVVRFYDPDRHVIEVGESMHRVVGRFLDGGLSVEETADRMDVPVGYVRSFSGGENRAEA